jgi:hypothetical protein
MLQALGSNSGVSFAARYQGDREQGRHESENSEQGHSRNQFEEYFDANKQGRGIWKWRHYFQIYERHFALIRLRLTATFRTSRAFSSACCG